jgi:hypothetical protein
MTRRTLLFVGLLALVPALWALPPAETQRATVNTIPARLTDAEFAKLLTELSEAEGFFRSDNLVSNEQFMQRVIPELVTKIKPGRAYLGVGPEQNFTYIAAVRPAIAFIIDIRRGNQQLHLMYRALFRLSEDRADFVSRLFSLKRPAGLSKTSTVEEIFTAYAAPELRSEALFKSNLAAIKKSYAGKDALALSATDLAGIEEIFSTFYARGLAIHYEIRPGSMGAFPSYADVMMATDGTTPRSYLASEEAFALVKDLQTRNLVVPVVGNFAGPKAMRAIGAYLKSHGGVVSSFYVSNVEQYLGLEDQLDEFCGNVATLPLDESSLYIRSERGGFPPRGGRPSANRGAFGGNFNSKLWSIRDELAECLK